MAAKERGRNPAKHQRGNRIVPADIPATKCENCGYVWPCRKTPRANRTMCPKCRTVNPAHFVETTLPGYVCTACDNTIYPHASTVKGGTVRCRRCGAYLAE